METSDGANKKPFRATGLLNKSQLKLASYIKAHNDVTLHGTKRFTDKSGEYYLKNVQLQNRRQDPNAPIKKNSLNNPQNLENCLNSGNIGKIRRRASKIVTLLPENSLTPIPKKDGINRLGMANGYGKKELKNAERTAVFIRRMEYATSMKRQMEDGKDMKNHTKKIQLIQEWWKTMFKILRLQKNIKGFLFRKKLMNNLEHQEKLLQFITEFDNIHNYHLYKNFMDKLKKKRDYEKAKLMEKCEDFNEILDNLEKLHNMKNLRKYFDKWRDEARQKKKEDMENLAKKLNDILLNRVKKNNLDAFNAIRDKGKSEEDKLNDKIKKFQERMAKQNFMRDLIRAHRLNKILTNAKNKIDDRLKKDSLDKLKKNKDFAEAASKLQKLLDDNMKRKTWNDLKTMDFVQKVDEVINYHNNKVNNDAKKEFLDKLRDISNKNKLRDKLKKWKDFNDEMKNRNKILQKLKRYKQNELRKKAEEEKNKFSISSGVNDFELISNKKPEPRRHRNSQIFISAPNDINFMAKPAPKMELQTAGQNFSLIAPEIIKFNFDSPQNRMKKIDTNLIEDQLNDLKSFRNKNDLKKYFDRWKEIASKKDIMDKLIDRMNDLLKKRKEKEDKFKQILDNLQNMKDNNDLREYFNRWRDAAQKMRQDSLDNLANKLNEILTKAKKESDDALKKDFLNKLKRINDIEEAVERLEYIMNEKPKKDALDTLKKNAGMSEGFRVLDKLFTEKANDLKIEAMNKIKQYADTIRALDNLDKLLNQKLKKKLLDNLKKNVNYSKGLELLSKVLQDNIRKKFMDELRKRNDLDNAIEILNRVLSDKVRKETLDYLKRRYRITKGTEKLDNLIMDKLRRKLMDKLKQNRDYEIASEILENLINTRLVKDAFNTLKKNNNIGKGIEILDNIFNDNDYKLKKEVLDLLKYNSDISNACDILDNLIGNKLKEDTFKRLKTIQFVDILDKMIQKHNDKNKREKQRRLIKNLKKIRNASEKKDKQDLRKAFEKWKIYRESTEIFEKIKILKKKIYLKKLKDACDRDKFFKEFFEFINKKKLKKYLDRWRDIADRRKIKDFLVEKARKKRAFDHWKNIKELRDILDNLKQNKKYELLSKYFNIWLDKCELKEVHDRLKDLVNSKKLKAYFDKWYNKTQKLIIIEKLSNYLKERKALNDWKKNLERKNILRNTRRNKILGNTIKKMDEKLLRKYFDRWKDIAKKLGEQNLKSKRISYRGISKRSKYKKLNDKKLLKQAFDIWRQNSSFEQTRSVLEGIKRSRLMRIKLKNKNDLLDKYKNKMMQVLINIYQRQIHLVLKKYLDKWRYEGNSDDEESDEPKYKKKKRIEDNKYTTESDGDTFIPTYYNQKQNVYTRRNIISYQKKVIQKTEQFNYDDIEEEKGRISDTSSNNESNLGKGEVLTQIKKVVISQSRNYTSQSFFIDKNVGNALKNNNYNYQMTTHNTNQLPMTLKGDFLSLIEKNPKLLEQKNARIQVTNATCDLNQIMDNEYTEDELNSEEVNYEMEKLSNNNFVFDKSKVLTKVIQNCDKDLYAAQRPFRVKKDKYYSVSIPLNDNEAKWEFINNIQGERDKNNMNKFELIQKEKEPIKEVPEENIESSPYSKKTFRSSRKKATAKENSYRLREINFTQFYRSPMRSPRVNDDDRSMGSSQASRIRRPERRKNTQTSLLNNTRVWNINISRNIDNYGSNNIDRSRGKIELDPRSRSIDYGNGYDDYDDSD